MEFFDFGRQPVSNHFGLAAETDREVFFRLAVGCCTSCAMVQQLEEVPREAMFGQEYPFRTANSSAMTKHFEQTALRLLETELLGPDPFAVEIGSNDGVTLKTISEAGVRHLGVDPSGDAAEVAARKGIRVHVDFFDENSAATVRAREGQADVIFSANTTSHIAYLDSVFRGVDILLRPNGVFVVEDRYLGDIIEHASFDQIYDEHFYLFAVGSVQAAAERFGFELVDVERFAVHGGSVRYTMARPGTRPVSQSVRNMLAEERRRGLTQPATLARFGADVRRIRADLVKLLIDLRSAGKRVVGYGATAKSATVTNYCAIGPDLVPFICDSTPEKQGRVTPGSHIPVRSPAAFANPYPDYALLFAWSHADEIIAKEKEFAAAGGRWILYVPDVHIV